jgi:hypothetical protein
MHRRFDPNASRSRVFSARDEDKHSGAKYSREAEWKLMPLLHESCGIFIATASGGCAAASAFLAAITANETAGRRQAYRFSPANYEKLAELAKGEIPEFDHVTPLALEGYLTSAKRGVDRAALMKRLAGDHGYTHLPGYCSVLWGLPLEALVSKNQHFELAMRRLSQICREFHLDPAVHPLEIARRWNGGDMGGRAGSGVYSWRLMERIKAYREIDRPKHRAC